MIEFQDYSFSYEEGKEELENINLKINKGEFIVVSGMSGSGKTTLGRVINGLIPHFYKGNRKGCVLINNKNINDDELWKTGSKVASVFQDPNSQFFAHAVKDEIAFGAENYGFNPDEIKKKTKNILNKFGIAELFDRNMFTLSNGEKQKIAIASALVANPSIFVFDEPSANLDAKSTYELANIMKSLKTEGKTIIVIEHRLYYIKNLLDSFVYMKEGKIKKIYSKQEFNSLSSEECVSLGIRTNKLVNTIEDITNKQKREEILRVKGLNFSYKGKKILQDVNFIAKRGEIIALLGLNGKGKTTLCNIIAGLLKESNGEIFINDERVKRNKRKKLIHYVMQETDCQLFAESVLDELNLGYMKSDNEKILRKFGLWKFKDNHPTALSGGQKQRLTLALSEKCNKDIIIFDEPTSGPDGKNMRITADYFKAQSRKGKTIIVVTHDFELVTLCCDRAIVLDSGEIKQDTNISDENVQSMIKETILS
ncbi:ABC transporter ATP-binding protein [Clostridiaceae bacterium M8S5]|nr:ABC transporter ATP-binding protein [Clostridiaceae bacterium M8S5]